jgi:hypothetical protein
MKCGFWNAECMYVCMCASLVPECFNWFYSCLAFKSSSITGQSWDSSIGIVPGYGLDDWGLIPGKGKIFLFSSLNWLWGPPSLLPNGYWGLFPRGVKQQGREADHSPPSSAKVKNSGAIPPLPNMSSWHNA